MGYGSTPVWLEGGDATDERPTVKSRASVIPQ